MWRALETAAAAFGAGPWRRRGRPLMLAQTGLPNQRVAHAPIAAPEGLPFVAFEGCRERLGAPASPLHKCPAHMHWERSTGATMQ